MSIYVEILRQTWMDIEINRQRHRERKRARGRVSDVELLLS